MANTLAQKFYLSKIDKEKSVFKINSDGALCGFSDEFLQFINEKTALKEQEYNEIRNLLEKTEKSSISEFSEYTEEELKEQLKSINQENLNHPYLKFKQILKEMKESFKDSEAVSINFKNQYYKDYGIRFFGFQCEMHLEKPELGINKVYMFPNFDIKKRNKNCHLPNSQCDINTYMTTKQLLASNLTDLTVPASWISVTDNPTTERFSQALNHWGIEITNYFNRFTSEEQKLSEEGLFKMLDKHPYKLFFLYNTTVKKGARIMFVCEEHKKGKYGINLLTSFKNNSKLEEVIRKNISEGISFDVINQIQKTSK